MNTKVEEITRQIMIQEGLNQIGVVLETKDDILLAIQTEYHIDTQPMRSILNNALSEYNKLFTSNKHFASIYDRL